MLAQRHRILVTRQPGPLLETLVERLDVPFGQLHLKLGVDALHHLLVGPLVRVVSETLQRSGNRRFTSAFVTLFHRFVADYATIFAVGVGVQGHRVQTVGYFVFVDATVVGRRFGQAVGLEEVSLSEFLQALHGGI